MFADNLKTLRRARGLSQEELAGRLHVTRQTISKWENALSVPDAELLLRLAEELEVPVSRLLGGPVEEEPAAEPKGVSFDDVCDALAASFRLTPREREVFRMLAAGRNREYIEEHLVISRNTVKAHVRHIYEKLGVHSHQDLIDLVQD